MLPTLHLQLSHRLIGHNLVDKLHVMGSQLGLLGWVRQCGPLVLGLIRDKGQGGLWEERGSECRWLQRWKVFILVMWNFPRINSCLQLPCASTTRLAGFTRRLCHCVLWLASDSFLMDGKPAKPP
jgi:hypothetical protein